MCLPGDFPTYHYFWVDTGTIAIRIINTIILVNASVCWYCYRRAYKIYQGICERCVQYLYVRTCT